MITYSLRCFAAWDGIFCILFIKNNNGIELPVDVGHPGYIELFLLSICVDGNEVVVWHMSVGQVEE